MNMKKLEEEKRKLENEVEILTSEKEYLQKCLERLQTLCDILGLVIEKKEELLDADVEALIAERQQARKEKNFAHADEIRAELLAKGIVLEDTREGVKWRRA